MISLSENSASCPYNDGLDVADAYTDGNPLTHTAMIQALGARAFGFLSESFDRVHRFFYPVTESPIRDLGSDILAKIQGFEGSLGLADAYPECETAQASTEKASNIFWRNNQAELERDPGIAEFIERSKENVMGSEGFDADWHQVSSNQKLKLLHDGMCDELRGLDPTYDFSTVQDHLGLATYQRMSQDIALLRIRPYLTSVLRLPANLSVRGLRVVLQNDTRELHFIPHLNLSNMGLTQLPNELRLFTSLRRLDLSGNRCTSEALTGLLSESLMELFLDDCPIETLGGATLPANLRYLSLRGCPIRTLVPLPASVEAIFL